MYRKRYKRVKGSKTLRKVAQDVACLAPSGETHEGFEAFTHGTGKHPSNSATPLSAARKCC